MGKSGPRTARARAWRSGQALVLAALFLFLVLMAAAAAVTVGSVYVARTRLQNAVDAAALAGAMAVHDPGAPADQLAILGRDDPGARGQLQLEDSPPDTVLARGSASVPGGFAALAGIRRFTVRARALASYGAPRAFGYAVFQGDTRRGDPPLTFQLASIVNGNVHSNDGLAFEGALGVWGSCGASGRVQTSWASGFTTACSGGVREHVPVVPMPRWPLAELLAHATRVVGSPRDYRGYTFNGTGDFFGNWVVYGTVHIEGAVAGPGSIVAIGGDIVMGDAGSTLPGANDEGVALAAFPAMRDGRSKGGNIVLQGAQGVWGSLYAPRGTIDVQGVAEINGSVVGYRVQSDGALAVTYCPATLAAWPLTDVRLIQ